MSTLPAVSISSLLEAGVHFGHKAARWNPKMAPYIYGVRDDVHIIDLQHTVALIQVAMKEIYKTVRRNGKVLFVGTKVQATDLMAECAEKCGQHYVNHRWLGGTLTNWGTVSRSIKKLEEYEQKLADEEIISNYTKKEVLDITRKKDKLYRAFSGIRSMGGRPDLIVIIDTNKEHLAIQEAKKLGIPIVAIVDTNCDPDDIDFPVPGNDDAMRSIKLYTSLFADAALVGIEESLSDSGVDIGAVSDISSIKVDAETGVTKIKSSKKVSKASSNEESSEAKADFEEALKQEKKTRSKKSEETN
ncbi:MAG: 30S ribosomal protein S2 [Rickettsiaceae bacterium]|nr:30S ribosomal protein S2 [Rickettsiaceae bacterium]